MHIFPVSAVTLTGPNISICQGPVPLAHAPFCQVIAGLGAPEVSQCRMTDMPSITALSAGPAVMLGAIPGWTDTGAHVQNKTS